MESVVIHHRPDRGPFRDLVPERVGIMALKIVTAPATVLGLALDHLPELLGRDQGPGVRTRAGLSAPLPARGGSRWPAVDRGRIGGGGLGRVGGVHVEPLFPIGDRWLEGLPQRCDCRPCVRRERIPEGLWERGMIRHAAVVPISSCKSNNGP
jgi:hypothetical protein